jgi:hypothetical protein
LFNKTEGNNTISVKYISMQKVGKYSQLNDGSVVVDMYKPVSKDQFYHMNFTSIESNLCTNYNRKLILKSTSDKSGEVYAVY